MNLAQVFLPLQCSLSPILDVSQADWGALNTSVSGRLHVATPVESPCFSMYTSADELACAKAQANYTSPHFRMDTYSASMYVEFETCMSTDSGCLFDTLAKDTLKSCGSCDLGEISPYYIDVRTASDVQAAFAFAERTRVPLSIKNTGHDLMGRARRRDSLGIWTHNLQSMTYDPQFVPETCGSSATYRIVTIGAGVTFERVYQFAEDHDAMFVGGYAQTVGASGGYLMGGGHSILSPTLGLAVDRVVEIKIVTPDGELRTANACQHPDLFWALRGGGGGTFGVVLESTHIVEQRIPLQVIDMQFIPTAENLPEYFEILVNHSVRWADEGWGGHVNMMPAGILHVNPRLSLEEAKESMAPLAAFAVAQNGSARIETASSWQDFFTRWVVGAQQKVGKSAVLGSRLIPKALFESNAGRAQLVAHLLKQTKERGMPYIVVGTPIAFNAIPDSTSVTPAWRNSLWHLVAPAGWSRTSDTTHIRGVLNSVHAFVRAELTALAPDSGAYLNEGDIYESDYQVSYWGPNYPRLLEVKHKYDPSGLLDCWRCVGWTNPAHFPCFPAVAP
ncbi:hypothetical protein C8R46DRAFT_1062570 [Mycena filopes]|nr:hypothetical protein C8R46DRAFT_1062570 [Mycena filopes]